MKTTIFLLALSAFQTTLFAQENPIVADRPGFSTGTYTVKPNKFNIETGYQYTFNNSSVDLSIHTLPQLVLRTGISSDIELDLLWNGWNIDHTDNHSSKTSISDVSIGGKYRLIENDKYNLTALALLSLPVGSSPSTSDHVDPLLGLLWDYSLSNSISAFGMLQAISSILEDGREYNLQPAIGLSFTHTSRIGTFVEYYSDIPLRSGSSSIIVIDGGLTYLLNDNIQLDINAGAGLNNASDNFIGTGIAIRF